MNNNTINASTLRQWLQNDEAQLVDVRESHEHSAAYIAGSTLMPLSAFHADKILAFSGKKIVIHCHSGRRSKIACEKILSANPAIEVYNLEGGISAWMQAGYPVKQSKQRSFSILQQVRLIIGSLVFTGTVLGYAFNTYFLCLPALAGVGLMLNGIIGACLLEKLLARMPWNKKTADSSPSCATN